MNTIFSTRRYLLSRLRPLLVCLWLLTAGSYLAGCQAPWASAVKENGYREEIVEGRSFLHRVISRPGADGGGDVLHVYIEGDGRPWTTSRQVALDPTPKRLLMLELMALDSHPAIYLGRPCYLAVADPRCHFVWWTHQRYAREIVSSLNSALDHYAQRFASIVLIGHSGGGTLAMLMAATRQDIDTVVTLAGNLDIDRWADLHGYSRLEGSESPVDHPLPDGIHQHHYVGQLDRNIPPQLITGSVATRANVTVTELGEVDHTCCWKSRWREILASLDTEQ